MYEHLRGKKLLIVGSALEEGIVNVAREMGIYTIVVDNTSDRKIARAKNIADEAWDLSYNETDEVVKRCKEVGVDGVFAGYGEFRVIAASRISKALGTPYYATEEQILLTADKRLFREECEKYDIPVPRNYSRNGKMTDAEKSGVRFPVIVKPSDRSGRIGISICHNSVQLDDAIDFALSKSENGTYVVEDYLNGVEFTAVYTIANGEYSLSSLDEKYITKDQKRENFLCDCSIAPAYFIDEFIKQVDNKIKKFLKGLGVKDGMANFQGMYTPNGIFLFEMGLRLNGNNDWIFIERTNNISFVKMMISHSLTGNMCDDLSKDNPKFKEYFCTLPIYAHEGVIAELDYSTIVDNPWVEISTQNAGVGSKIEEDGTSRQKVIAFLINASNLKELKERIKFIQESLVVKDTDGKDMKFQPFDYEVLRESI